MIIQPARLAMLTDHIAGLGIEALAENTSFVPAVKSVIDCVKGTPIYLDMFKSGYEVINWHSSPKTLTQHVSGVILALEMHVIQHGCSDGINGVAEYISKLNSNAPYWGCLVHPVFAQQYAMILGKSIADYDIFTDVQNQTIVYSSADGQLYSAANGSYLATANIETPAAEDMTLVFSGHDHSKEYCSAGWTAQIAAGETTAPLLPTDGHRRITDITSYAVTIGNAGIVEVLALRER